MLQPRPSPQVIFTGEGFYNVIMLQNDVGIKSPKPTYEQAHMWLDLLTPAS